MGIVRRAPNLLPMLRATLLAVLLSVTSALQVGVPASAVSRSTVSMNTQYSDPYAFQKKKTKSGRGELLKGYTVGSLAPGVAVKSGTTVSQMGTSYGISNRFGGKINGQKVTATDEEPKDNNAAIVFSVLSIATLFFDQRPPADPLNAAVDLRPRLTAC